MNGGPSLQEKNKKLARRLGFTALFMVGLAFASVPLYSLFCKATGFGGLTQVAERAPGTTSERTVTVRYNTDVAPGLPWEFRAVSLPVTVKLGEVKQLLFTAKNDGSKDYKGISIYNVLPERAGLYFNKIQCFCFDEETLKAGETAEFPVQFFVDPAMADDPLMADVKTITLSYTFFSSKSPKLKQAQAAFDAWQSRLIEEIRKP
jgi:cytochrome c oxidase assembly protein subunit 11